MLVMEYVPGTSLFNVRKPFEADKLEQTAADLGRYNTTSAGSPLSCCCAQLISANWHVTIGCAEAL